MLIATRTSQTARILDVLYEETLATSVRNTHPAVCMPVVVCLFMDEYAFFPTLDINIVAMRTTLDAGTTKEMHCVSHGGSRQIDDLQKLWCTHLPGVRARYGQDGHRATANHHSPAKNQCPLYRLPSWVCCKCVQTDIMRSSGFCGFVVCIFSVCDSPSTLSRLSGLSSLSRTSSSLVVSRSAIAHGLSQTKLIAVLCRLGVSQETMSSWQEWMLAATGHSDRMLVHPNTGSVLTLLYRYDGATYKSTDSFVLSAAPHTPPFYLPCRWNPDAGALCLRTTSRCAKSNRYRSVYELPVLLVGRCAWCTGESCDACLSTAAGAFRECDRCCEEHLTRPVESGRRAGSCHRLPPRGQGPMHCCCARGSRCVGWAAASCSRPRPAPHPSSSAGR